MRSEVDFFFLHICTIGRLGAKACPHLLFHVCTITYRGGICSTDIGDLGTDVLTNIFRIHTTVVAAGHRDAEDPLAALLGNL